MQEDQHGISGKYSAPQVATILVVAFTALTVGAIITGCCPSDSTTSFPEIDNTADVESYYANHPEFFRYATTDDIPLNLMWQNGDDLPDLGSPDARKGGTYHSRISDFPRTFRTVGPDSNSSFRPYLQDDFTLSFAHLHPNMEHPHRYYPALAEEWAVDQSSRTVYIRIHPNARWSNGNPVTVDDVFFMFYFYQSPHIRAPWYNNWYGIGINYENVTRYNERVFSVTTREARPNFDTLVLELRPLPRAFYKEVGEDFTKRYQWRFAPTTGPYVITDEEIQRIRHNRNRISLMRLDDWWARDLKFFRNRFNPDEIRLTVIRNTPKAFEAFLMGQLDMHGMSLAEYHYEMLPNDHPLVANGFIHKSTFYNDIPRPTYGLWINTSRPFLDNVDVRTGIQYASNWQKVIDQYFRGDYTRMNTSADGYGDMTNPYIQARPFDPKRAREHFAKAGFDRVGPDGILRNADDVRLTFTVTTGYEPLRSVISILREEALKAGLELQLEILDASANWKKVQEKNHDIAFVAFGVGVEPYPRYWETVHSVNAYDEPYLDDGVTPNPARRPKVQTNNIQAIAVPELDRLIERYDRSEDLNEMRDLAYRMEEILYEHASFVPGFIMPFYRIAYWRWIRWPEDFNVRFSSDPTEYYLFWIDLERRTETEEARSKVSKIAQWFTFWNDRSESASSGKFEKHIRVHEQWRVDQRAESEHDQP